MLLLVRPEVRKKVTLGREAPSDLPIAVPQDDSTLTSGARVGRRRSIGSRLAGWLVFCWALIELPVELWVSQGQIDAYARIIDFF